MPFNSRHVQTIKSSPQPLVSTADGNCTPVIREGTISFINNLSLDTVLIVPSLDYNILSFAELTVALNCIVLFWPFFYVFKDKRTSRT